MLFPPERFRAHAIAFTLTILDISFRGISDEPSRLSCLDVLLIYFSRPLYTVGSVLAGIIGEQHSIPFTRFVKAAAAYHSRQMALGSSPYAIAGTCFLQW
jgi:hypothetical protein